MGVSSYWRIQLGLAVLVCLISAAMGQQRPEGSRGAFNGPALGAGKPVVLLFLRTDCPISNRYAPTIQSLASKYAGRVEFWLVYPSKKDTEQVISMKLVEFGYKLPWVRDPNHLLAARGKATITPEAAVFDAAGLLRYHGRIDNWYVSFGRTRRSPTKNDLDDALTAVLAGKAVGNDASPAVGCYISDLD